jgi:deoxyribose-phosphate aldolase
MERHVAECIEYGFDAAMVGAAWVPEVRKLLAGSAVKVASALDFPYGCMTTAGRVAEMRALVAAGVDEVDIGVQIGWLRSGDLQRFNEDLVAVVAAADAVTVKVMLELPLLDPEQREVAVAASVKAGVAYVKNVSSGIVGLATAEDIRWLRSRIPEAMRIKASGGITTREQTSELLAAGADLIGTSTGVEIVTGARKIGGSY